MISELLHLLNMYLVPGLILIPTIILMLVTLAKIRVTGKIKINPKAIFSLAMIVSVFLCIGIVTVVNNYTISFVVQQASIQEGKLIDPLYKEALYFFTDLFWQIVGIALMMYFWEFSHRQLIPGKGDLNQRVKDYIRGI